MCEGREAGRAVWEAGASYARHTVPAGASAPCSASSRLAVTWLDAKVAACLPPWPSKTPKSPTRTSPAGSSTAWWA